MIIGIPKEIKNNENRVALTPSGAQELTKRGHKVYVQASAGVNSGFADDAYTAVGAEMLPTIEDVYARAEMIIKVKEPIAPEYQLIRKDQLVFTFFHFASSEPLTRAMVDSGAVCCAYETVERADRSLPLLIPMSEVAGRMAAQEGRYFLEKPRGGKGVLLGGVPEELRGEIERLWPYGYCNADRLQPDDKGIAAVAQYIAKQEGSANGQHSRKEKSWSGSRNLKQPATTTSDSRSSRRRVSQIAADVRRAGREIFEAVYPGYRTVEEPTVALSDFCAGAYIRAKLRIKNRAAEGRGAA